MCLKKKSTNDITIFSCIFATLNNASKANTALFTLNFPPIDSKHLFKSFI